MSEAPSPLELVGWRELVTLPDLAPARIRAKIDTGAQTSSLHATEVKHFEKDGQAWVRFVLDTGAEEGDPQWCEVPCKDRRVITSSNGEAQERYVIETRLKLGEHIFDAEFSLADRSDMKFPILIGRAALRKRFLVNSSRSFLQSPQHERKLLRSQG